jgi:hypothetical protein
MELGMRLYDLPAFRRFQEELGENLLNSAAQAPASH